MMHEIQRPPGITTITGEKFSYCRHELKNALSAFGFLKAMPNLYPEEPQLLAILPIYQLGQHINTFLNSTVDFNFDLPNQTDVIRNRLKREIGSFFFRQHMDEKDKQERISWFKKINSVNNEIELAAIVWEFTAQQLRVATQLLVSPEMSAINTIIQAKGGEVGQLYTSGLESLKTTAEMASLFAALSKPELLQQKFEGLEDRVNAEGLRKIQQAFRLLDIPIPDPKVTNTAEQTA